MHQAAVLGGCEAAAPPPFQRREKSPAGHAIPRAEWETGRKEKKGDAESAFVAEGGVSPPRSLAD